MTHQLCLNTDTEARDARRALDGAKAIVILAGDDVAPVRGLIQAAEVAAICELILDNLDVTDRTDHERFNTLYNESQAIMSLFSAKYDIRLVETTAQGHTVEAPASNGKTVRHIKPSQSFAAKTNGNGKHQYHRPSNAKLKPDQVVAIREYWTSSKPGWGQKGALLAEIAQMYDVSTATIDDIVKGHSHTSDFYSEG
jgi:hypothetical protein